MLTLLATTLTFFITSASTSIHAQPTQCCSSVFVSASVELNPIPEQERIPGNSSRTSGAFTVTNEWDNFKRVWDGATESYSWEFDLTNSPSYPDFEECASNLNSAHLRLLLTCPQNDEGRCGPDIRTDGITIGTLPTRTLSELRALIGETPGETIRRIQVIDLLASEEFTSSDLLEQIRLGRGILQMKYADDARVEYAQIDIVASPDESGSN